MKNIINFIKFYFYFNLLNKILFFISKIFFSYLLNINVEKCKNISKIKKKISNAFHIKFSTQKYILNYFT